MIMNPETTVIITCYNYGMYLDGCLRSVLAQTYTNYEIIVIDDGSTDSTPEVIQKHLGLLNLRYIRQDNGGQAKAKNRGIQEAQGRYVAFLDADDLWEREKLERQVRLFENLVVGVVYSRAKYIDENGSLLAVEEPSGYLAPRSGKVVEWLFLDNFVPFSSVVIRRECLDKFGPFDETLKMGIDWDLWLRISTNYEFNFVDAQLLAYRVGHAGQMSKNAEVRHQCSDRIMTSFLSRYPDVVSNNIIRDAYYYTYCNRGEHFRKIDKKKSYNFIFKAIAEKPLNIRAYKEIVKNLIY